VLRQVGDGLEVLGVDERFGRSEFRVVASAENDGDHVVVENLEELFGDVVVAKRVLEAQVELVLGLQHLHAPAFVGLGTLEHRLK